MLGESTPTKYPSSYRWPGLMLTVCVSVKDSPLNNAIVAKPANSPECTLTNVSPNRELVPRINRPSVPTPEFPNAPPVVQPAKLPVSNPGFVNWFACAGDSKQSVIVANSATEVSRVFIATLHRAECRAVARD